MLLSNFRILELITSLSYIIIALLICFSHIVNASSRQASYKMNQCANSIQMEMQDMLNIGYQFAL